MLSEIYGDLILDHCRNPRNYGDIHNATHRICGHNPLCGDKIELTFIVKDNHIENIKFKGKGCAISQASASIMTNELLGKTTEEAILLFNVFHEMLTREDFSEKNIFVDSFFKKAGVFLNIKNFPTRVKCATLAWHSFNLALKENKPQQNDNIN